MKKQQPVSIVIPMYNGGSLIAAVLEAIFGQDYGGDVEVILVNDGSRDNSPEVARKFLGKPGFRIIDQENQGAVSATNNGFKAATHDIIISVDADVVLSKDWLSKVVEEFSDPEVGAVQGYYKTPGNVSLMAKMMGYDVEARYDSIRGKYVTQVCTGNTAYRREALDKVGLFDARFKYGYDNDMSYRLGRAGYKLVFRKDAVCDHYWKADIAGYARQQYRSAYGRMQLVRKHTDKVSGDSVSGLRMIMQVPLTFLFLLIVLLGVVFSDGRFYLAAYAVFMVIFLDRAIFALGVYAKQRDMAAWFMPFVHLMRNFVWCAAAAAWVVKAVFVPSGAVMKNVK
ncbi:MAG: glycosyltransferase [Deltaproteobacteria bacterium]|nr:glycosyltransferase [Deltaproteobacteria bacterium]